MNNTSDPGRAPGSINTGMRADRPRHVEWTADVDNWKDHAACLGQHPKAHHRDLPEKDRQALEWIEGDPRTKKKWCNGGELRWFDGRAVTLTLPVCPVRDQCLKSALEMDPLPAHGVWGGLDQDELKAKASDARVVTVAAVKPKPRGATGPGCGNSYGSKRHRKNGELPCFVCVAHDTDVRKKARAERRSAQRETA